MAHHLHPHIHHTELCSSNVLHVIGVVSNVERYHSRYRLARDWQARMAATAHVQVHIVEAAFGDRHHEILTEEGHGLRLRVQTNAWIKENMINLGVQHLLPRDWQYVCWCDMDVEFRDPFFAQETLHQLQHFNIVQPWQQCVDLGPCGNILQTHTSFGYVDQLEVKKQAKSGEPYQFGHPGYAWACTRAFWEQTEGLLDIGILGSGDHMMAWACINQVERSIHRGMTDGYRRAAEDWQRKAIRKSMKEVGYVNGRIEHFWHGSKKHRFYKERWQILIEHAFDPLQDLMRDEQGVIHIVGKPALERALRKYNRSRLEDGIDEG